MRDPLTHHILVAELPCSHMARGCAGKRLTAGTLGQMEGLVGSVDLGVYSLFGEGQDLRDAWIFRLLRVCLVTLAVAQLLPAFSGFLFAFLRLCVWLQLVSGFAQLPSF